MRVEEAARVVIRPYITEKTFSLIERENKLVFLVGEGASKRTIKEAVEALYGVRVSKVNTSRTPVGKKAFVKLAKEGEAMELASRLGLV